MQCINIMKKRMHRTDFYITQKQYKKLKNIADDEERTISEIFRKAIDYYLEKVCQLPSDINHRACKE